MIVDEMDLNGLAESWLKYLKINRNRSDNTISSYASDIDQFIAYLEWKRIPGCFYKQIGEQAEQEERLRHICKNGKEGGIGRRISPHVARHTCGMLLTELDVDSRLIRQHLGHKSSIMTDHYSKVRDMKYRNLVGVFGNLATRLSGLRSTCVYLAVVDKLLCPSCSWIYRMSMPFSSSWVAQVWRMRWEYPERPKVLRQ